ncbi:MAG: hypothetical protein ACFFCS_12905 [Candidatus Hodarchaeota archaeon]
MINFKNAFKKVVNSFERLETELDIKYMIVGGTLTPLYSQARQTNDIDTVIEIDLDNPHLSRFKQFLMKEGFQPFSNWDDTIQNWPMNDFITLMIPDNPIKLDINVIRNDGVPGSPYKEIGLLAMPRRERMLLEDIEFWALSKEDFILAKLVYQGIQDYKDAISCFMQYEEVLDKQYLLKNARVLGVDKYLVMLMKKEPVDKVFPDDF